MASVTQRVPSYLGGVSRQPDVMKKPGQVREAINAYPDPTFGLIKRSGTRFTKELGDSTDYKDAFWFSIFRDNKEGYVGCIKGSNINIWNVDGTVATVTYEGGSQAYLSGTSQRDYQVLSVQDLSLVTNKRVTVKTLPASTPTTGYRATLRVLLAAYRTKYEVTINGTSKSWITRNTDTGVGAADTPKEEVTVNEILDKYVSEINAMLVPGLTVTRLKDSLELYSDTFFTITSNSGADNLAVQVFTKEVQNLTELPKESIHHRQVTVLNTATDDSTYYLQFVAEDGVKGRGYWEEALKPGISSGLDPSTMPHELKNTALNTFVFRTLAKDPAAPEKFYWEPRLVGDDKTNSHPSFVGSTIQQSFFYNNRLGFLTGDNVSMSQVNEFFNFYHMTALTQTAADPIDLSCSSVKPAVLHAVLPAAQGLVLFSNSQQFLMTSSSGVFSPGNTVIKTIGTYEMDDYVDPVDMGTSFVFISKNPNFTRVFEMITRGEEQNPIITDIGRIVGDWIPAGVDQLIASPQNSFFTLASQAKDTLYMLRSYAEGEDVIISGWVKWRLPGNIQYHVVDRDTVYFMTDVSGKFVLSSANLNQVTTDEVLISPKGERVDPRLDLWQLARDITFDKSTNTSRLYVDHAHYSSLQPVIITVEQVAATYSGKTNAGSFYKPIRQGSDAKGSYFEIDRVDLTQYSKIALGYIYDFEIELPTQYYTLNAEGGADYSASLTIARYRFAVGLNGEMIFQVKAMGREEWEDRQPVIDANYYIAGASPMVDQKILTIPIHQKSTHHSVRLVSDSPYPTSLISMVWEGLYSPRFYQRN